MHRFSNVHKTNTEIESLLRSNDITKKIPMVSIFGVRIRGRFIPWNF